VKKALPFCSVMPQPTECAFRASFGGGAPPSLSSKDEPEHDCSGGGPPSESEPPRVLAEFRSRVGTAGAAVAGVRRRTGVAAGVRSVAAEAEVQPTESVRPRIGSGGGGLSPSSSDKSEFPACVSQGRLVA
jgi:hypothetical protein